MYGARTTASTAGRPVDPEAALWAALSEIAEMPEMREALGAQSTHGTFGPPGQAHRIDLEGQRDCCDRGFSRVVGCLARRWARFAEDHELLSKIVSASLMPLPLGFGSSVIACVGAARNDELMTMAGAVFAGGFGLIWLGLVAVNMRDLVEREASRYC